MRLAGLDAVFLRVVDRGKYRHVATFAEAHGVRFTCPQCGDHQVLVWFKDRDAPPGEEPLPRWSASGSGLDDLTLSPSINVRGCWHGFVQGGEIR